MRLRKPGFLAVQRNIQSPPAVFVFLSSICVLRGIVFVQDRPAIFLSSAETDYAGSAEWFTAISRGPTTSMVQAEKIWETVQNTLWWVHVCSVLKEFLFQTFDPYYLFWDFPYSCAQKCFEKLYQYVKFCEVKAI